MSTMRTVASIARHTRGAVRRRLGLLDISNEAGCGTVPRTMRLCTAADCRICGKRALPKRQFRIVYLAPAWDAPSGGNKVIYQHVEAIARLGRPCWVFHPARPGSTYTWMKHQVQSLAVGHFDPHNDFLVFPEVWAAWAAEFCVPAGLKYAIFVQNGYLAHASAGFSFDRVAEAYRYAALVLSISDDTSEMLRLLFPFLEPERIQRVYCSVPHVFAPASKEALITYMPRKLRGHAARLEVYLRNSLPEWRLQAIDEMPVHEVAALMARSSIFLSLADMEGYGLPPVEAALAGNLVVGYTGQGAREYFSRPIFREVPNGDLKRFISEVKLATRDVIQGIAGSAPFQNQVAALAAAHSTANEEAHVWAFARRAHSILERTVGATAEHPRLQLQPLADSCVALALGAVEPASGAD